jgi:hypothetical protein
LIRMKYIMTIFLDNTKKERMPPFSPDSSGNPFLFNPDRVLNPVRVK